MRACIYIYIYIYWVLRWACVLGGEAVGDGDESIGRIAVIEFPGQKTLMWGEVCVIEGDAERWMAQRAYNCGGEDDDIPTIQADATVLIEHPDCVIAAVNERCCLDKEKCCQSEPAPTRKTTLAESLVLHPRPCTMRRRVGKKDKAGSTSKPCQKTLFSLTGGGTTTDNLLFIPVVPENEHVVVQSTRRQVEPETEDGREYDRPLTFTCEGMRTERSRQATHTPQHTQPRVRDRAFNLHASHFRTRITQTSLKHQNCHSNLLCIHHNSHHQSCLPRSMLAALWVTASAASTLGRCSVGTYDNSPGESAHHVVSALRMDFWGAGLLMIDFHISRYSLLIVGMFW